MYPDASMEWIHYLEIPLGFVQQCTMDDKGVTQARIRRYSDQRLTPIRAIVQAPDWHVNY